MSEKTHSSLLSSCNNAGHETTDLCGKFAELSVAPCKQAHNEQLKRSELSPEAREEIQDNEKTFTVEEIVQGLKSNDLAVMTACARAAHRRIFKEQEPVTLDVMVSAGVIKPLVDALERDDCPDLQFEAAWAIMNIASGTNEHAMSVVDGGAIPKLVALLARGGKVSVKCAWALGNIAEHGPQTRDTVLSHGALPALLPLCTASTPVSQLRATVWTYSQFCSHENPRVKFDYVAPGLPYISDLLEIADEKVLEDACWALTNLTAGPNEHIEAVQMTPRLLPRINALLAHKSPKVHTAALLAIGNMLAGSYEQKERCLGVGCLNHIIDLLRCGELSLMRDAAWAVSKILAGTAPQIQRAIDGGVLAHLLHVLATEDINCQKRAAWAIRNLCRHGTPEQLDALISAGLLEPYCQLLHAPDHEVITVVLEGLTKLLKAAVKNGQLDALAMKLEEIGALKQIENLQEHENEKDLCGKFAEFSVALRKQARDEQLLKRSKLSPEAGEKIQDKEKTFTVEEIVQGDACWALSYLTDGHNERIEAVQMTPRLLPRINALLAHKSPAVRTPALRAIGNMLTGSDEQKDRCLDVGCLNHIIDLLRCGEPTLMQDAARAVSNILAGTAPQIQRAIDGGVLAHLLHVLATEDIKCQKQAAWAIKNLCRHGTPEQLDALISTGFLEPYCQLLHAPDHEVITMVLDGLTNFLKMVHRHRYDQQDALALQLEEIGALEQIEKLQEHENEKISKKAMFILDKYFTEP